MAWQTLAAVLHRVQSDLDRPWDLDSMAAVSGYQRHHLAHLFSDVVGEPPARYVRRLRLERASYELMEHLPVATVATRAGYGSAEAFTRAFKRHFGVAPRGFRRHAEERALPPTAPPSLPLDADLGESPMGLDPAARISAMGPLHGWTLIVPSFSTMDVGMGMAQLLGTCPPDGPWQVGGLAQPWGWLTEDALREFRCLRLLDAPRRLPPPPVMQWSWPEEWFAVFDFEGPLDQIADACGWMAAVWPQRVGLRLGYGPLFSLVETMQMGPVRAKLHLPVRRLTVLPS